MASSSAIAAGQRYRDVRRGMFGRLSTAWIVAELLTGTDGVEYARLVAAGDPSRRKTLAVSMLGDRSRFERIDAGDPPGT